MAWFYAAEWPTFAPPLTVLTLPRPLPAGTYDLKWHIVGADQHKMEGGYSFTVK